MSQTDEYLDHCEESAVLRWKWKNPYIAAAIAFIFGPFGLFYFSWKKAIIALILVFILAEAMRYNGWWPPTLWIKLFAMLSFAIYAYMDTRYTNAAIEHYKYGLSGTGTQDPSAESSILLRAIQFKQCVWGDTPTKIRKTFHGAIKWLYKTESANKTWPPMDLDSYPRRRQNMSDITPIGISVKLVVFG